MSARAWLLAACLAAACGRGGFAELHDSGGSADASSRDAPPDAAMLPASVISTQIATFSTTSATFVPVTSITLPPSQGRDWIVFFSGNLETSTLAEVGVEIRYLIDGTEQGYGGTQSSAVGRPGPWLHFHLVPGAATETPIEVQLHDASGGTASVTDLRVIALELPQGAAARYSTSDAIRMISNTTYQATQAFTLNLPPGDYVVFTLVNASDAPGEADAFIQWRDSSNNLHLPDTQQPRMCWQSMLTAWSETVTGTSLTATLEAKVGGAMSSLQDIRVLAVPTTAFTVADVKTSTATTMSSSATPTTVASLVTAPPSGSAFFYLTSVRLTEDCTSSGFADRAARFTVDGVERGSIVHRAANCAYQTTYGTIGVTTTPPTNITTSVSSGNTLPFFADESATVLLGLP